MPKKWRSLAPLALLLLLLASACTTTQATQPAPVIGEPQIPESEVPRVSLADAWNAYEAGAAVFLDVRAASSYETSHIPGALSIPLNDLETRLSELDPAQWIITYCT